MDAIKHTPWRVTEPHPQNACAYVVDARGDDVAALYGGDEGAKCTNGIWSEQPVRDARACLIAAAPEMADLLRRASEADSPNDDVRTMWWEERAAVLAKATGGDA